MYGKNIVGHSQHLANDHRIDPRTIFSQGRVVLFFVLFILSAFLFNIFVTLLTADGFDPGMGRAYDRSGLSRTVLEINETKSFDGADETRDFYSGKTMTLICNVTHSDGVDYITGVNVTIRYNETGSKLLEDTPMERLNGTTASLGDTWVWFGFSLKFPVPTPRGEYRLILTASSNSTGISDAKNVSQINILNYPPTIKGQIGPIYKPEDALEWVIDLAGRKADVEDADSNLTWDIVNVNDSLLTVNVQGDNLIFNTEHNVHGSNELKLGV